MRWSACGARNWTSPRPRASPRSRTELRLIAVGRLRAGAEAELFARYNARLRPALAVTEVAEGAGKGLEAKRREATGLLAAVPQTAFAIALDLGGVAPDSSGLLTLLEQWRATGRVLCFLIGGAEGLDAAVLARSDAALSLGGMTWPHFLVRAMFAEQLYRAQTIAQNHPYHRDGRP